MTMKDATHPHTNDNDAENPLPFISLAALTANVVNYLATPPRGPNQSDDSADDAEPKKRRERRQNADRDYVEQRAREIAEFENRAAGLSPHRRSRPDRR